MNIEGRIKAIEETLGRDRERSLPRAAIASVRAFLGHPDDAEAQTAALRECPPCPIRDDLIAKSTVNR